MPKARRGNSVITKIISGESLQQVKKFGFGSNLVDFTTPATVPSNPIEEAIAPPNDGEAYRNMFDPAYNVWNKGEWESDGRRFVVDISDTEGERRRGGRNKVSDDFVEVPDPRNLHDQFYDYVGLLLDGQLLDKSKFGNRVKNGYGFFRAVVFEEENHRSAKFRNYYSLDGRGKRLEINDFSRNNDFGSEFFTFEMWIRPERKDNDTHPKQAADNSHTLLDMRPQGAGRLPSTTYTECPVIKILDAFDEPQGEIEFSFRQYGTSTFFLRSGDGVIWNEWNHIAVQRHDGDISIYINGVKKATHSNSASLRASGNFNIGHDVGSGSDILGFSSGFKGDIALVRNTPGVARYANLDSFNADATITTFNVPPLNPNSISGLQVWCDANDRTSIKDTAFGVEFWGDKSGNGNHLVQTNASLRPHLQYNESIEKPTMRFSGTRDQSKDDLNDATPNGDFLECATDLFSTPTGSGSDGKAARISIFLVYKILSGLEDGRVISYNHTLLSLLNTGTLDFNTAYGNPSTNYHYPSWKVSNYPRAYGSRAVSTVSLRRRDNFNRNPQRGNGTSQTMMTQDLIDQYALIDIEWGGNEFSSGSGGFDYFDAREVINYSNNRITRGRTMHRNPYSFDKFVVGAWLKKLEDGSTKVLEGSLGNIAEILVYKGGISEVDKKNIRNYLKEKWETT